MPVVLITGVAGALGRRVVARLAEPGPPERRPLHDWAVVGIDTSPFPAGVAKPHQFTVHRVDVGTAPLPRLFHGADIVVALATIGPENPEGAAADARLLQRTLDAAAAVDAGSVVVLSSSVVYGARPDNPVPLTESASLRADPRFAFAAQKLALERIVEDWRTEHPQVPVCILRVAPVLGHPDARAWLARSVRPSLTQRLLTTVAPMQFVHVEDVADAIVHALRCAGDGHPLDGPFNVAPDDWLTPDAAQALFGPNLAVPLPDRVIDVVAGMSERFTVRRRPAGALDYTRHPWVVANDRLKATGWSAASSSAEALVAARRPRPFARLYARRRQEVTLALVGTGIASGLASLLTGGLWLRRRKR